MLLLLACSGPRDTASPVETAVDSDTGEASCGRAVFLGGGGEVDYTEAFSTGEAVHLQEDGTLEFCRGTWFVQLVVSAQVTVRGEGADNTVLSGGETHTILQVEGESSHLIIEDLALDRGAARSEEGNSGSGGGLHCSLGASVTVRRALVSNNTGYDGAGIYGRDGCAIEVEDTVFLGNRSVDDGAGFRVNHGTATLRAVRFEDNRARDGGAMIFHESTVLIDGAEFVGNVSTDSQGGAILHYFAPLTIRNATFESNESLSWGGALALFGDTTLENVVFRANRSGEGGAITLYPEHGTLSCQGCSFESNDPDDVSLYEGEGYTFGEDASFDCDSQGCE